MSEIYNKNNSELHETPITIKNAIIHVELMISKLN